jgi:hypothetical protein
LESVSGFFIKMKGCYKKFRLAFGTGSTKLNQRVNPIVLPETLKIFLA